MRRVWADGGSAYLRWGALWQVRMPAIASAVLGRERPVMARTAVFRGCKKSFGYVKDNDLAETLRHSPEVDPKESSPPIKAKRQAGVPNAPREFLSAASGQWPLSEYQSRNLLLGYRTPARDQTGALGKYTV